MNPTIPTQHPAVVLRSHYLAVRALLAVATVAIVGLTIAVVALAATRNDSASIATPSARVSLPAMTADTDARVDHRGIRTNTRAPLETPTSPASCGDVCSSYRQASTTTTPPTASAASCGDVCSSHRQAR